LVECSIPDEKIRFFNSTNPASCIKALWSAHPLTEMITRNLFGGKRLPPLKSDNITAIDETII
jgi:hypothetical protein